MDELTVRSWQLADETTVNRQLPTVNRLATIALAALLITFSIDRLYLLYAHKFYDITGRAEWIWAQHQLSRDIPVAFFATREFDLPSNRAFTHVKVAGDPEAWERPMLLGRPPIGRWNYLGRQDRNRAEPAHRVVAPRDAFDFKTALPVIEVRAGVAVTVPQPKRASVFDFNPITARARLTLRYTSTFAHVVNVRFANERSELYEIEGPVEQFVFAEGERTVVDPVERR